MTITTPLMPNVIHLNSQSKSCKQLHVVVITNQLFWRHAWCPNGKKHIDLMQSCHSLLKQESGLLPQWLESGQHWDDRQFILPMIQLESHWWFKSFRYKLGRHAVSVAAKAKPCATCGVQHCVAFRMFIGANRGVTSTCPVTLAKKAAIWAFGEDAKCTSLQMVVANCQKSEVAFIRAWSMWSKCTSKWFLMCFLFVTCTDNCSGETL